MVLYKIYSKKSRVANTYVHGLYTQNQKIGKPNNFKMLRQTCIWLTINVMHLVGTLLHLPSPFGPDCPSRHISMINDEGWKKLEQIGFEDPDGTNWLLHHRKENIGELIYDNAISIKLTKDNRREQMFTGAYYRSADILNGGAYHVRI